MQPICCNCRIVMRCEKNHFIVRDPEVGGFPSTYWVGDKWKCPVCDHEIVTGFAKKSFPAEQAEQEGVDQLDFEAGKEALEFRYNV